MNWTNLTWTQMVKRANDAGWRLINGQWVSIDQSAERFDELTELMNFLDLRDARE